MGKQFNNLNNSLKKKYKYIFSKDGNSEGLKILEQISVSVKKTIPDYFTETLAGSQMKVKPVLNIFYNFISNICTMYVSIKDTHSLYAKFA